MYRMKGFRSFFTSLYDYCSLLVASFTGIFKPPYYWDEVRYQMKSMGVSSLPIVILTSFTTGMVFALQTGHVLSLFGAKMYLGSLVGISMLCELGPVLTALVLSGRIGSGISSELASMKVTEQIDALRAMGINPIKKLASTRLLAGLIIIPILTVLSIASGIIGGMIISVGQLGISYSSYKKSVFQVIMLRDVFMGFVKPFIFALVIITVSVYLGFTCSGGTEGVGKATTRSVVISSIFVLVGDFFITKIILMLLY